MHKIKFQNANGLLDSMTQGSSRGWITLESDKVVSKHHIFGVQGCILQYKIASSQLDAVVASTKSVLDLLTRIVSPDKLERLHTIKIFEVQSELAKVSTSKVCPEGLHAMRSLILDESTEAS